MDLFLSKYQSPIGEITLAANNKGLCMLEFDNQIRIDHHIKQLMGESKLNIKNSSSKILKETKLQLDDYFSNKRKGFDLPLYLVGSTFQKSVWKELQNIPFGKTRSYKDQASAIGNLKAIRAVASANGQNRISIIIPCHRVIGSNGELTGYGGELWRKKFLLELESNQYKLL